MVLRVIKGKVKGFEILSRTAHDEAKEVFIRVQKDNVIYKLGLNRDTYGTYRDDNVSKVANLLKVGKEVNLIEGECGLAICIGGNLVKGSYYAPNSYILPDVSVVKETILPFEDVIKAIEDEGWSIEKEEDGYHLRKHTPAGEDFGFSIELKEETQESMFQAIYDYANDFDIDEHVELWINNRGKNGIPSSIKVLVEDAEDIVEMLKSLLRKIRGM